MVVAVPPVAEQQLRGATVSLVYERSPSGSATAAATATAPDSLFSISGRIRYRLKDTAIAPQQLLDHHLTADHLQPPRRYAREQQGMDKSTSRRHHVHAAAAGKHVSARREHFVFICRFVSWLVQRSWRRSLDEERDRRNTCCVARAGV